MKFKNAKEMLNLIQSGVDLYNVITGDYVFLYSDEGAIAAYNFDIEYAKELSECAVIANEESWSGFLGFGGNIYENSAEINYCEEHYHENFWLNTSDLDKAWNRKFAASVRRNEKCFIGFGFTADEAKQAAVNRANDFSGEDYTVDDYIKNYGEACFEIIKWYNGRGYELDIK